MDERIKQQWQALKQLRDQIRVKLHLANQEARERWQEIEPKLEEVEHKLEEGGEKLLDTTHNAFEELGRSVREFGERLLGGKR